MATKNADKYIEGIGRRKEAIARVRIYPAQKGTFTVNDKKVEEYFDIARFEQDAKAALEEMQKDMSVTVKVSGGGKMAQSQAIRMGIARALTEHDAELRGELKSKGYLKRDPRAKERRKFGLKKARKAAQWSKR